MTLTGQTTAPSENALPMIRYLTLPSALSLAILGSLNAQTVLVQPYLQPGNGSVLRGSDVKVISWVTDQTPGEFTLEYAVNGKPMQKASIERVALDFAPAKEKRKSKGSRKSATPEPALSLEEAVESAVEETGPVLKEREQHYFKYSATLGDLPFDTSVSYRVRLGTAPVRTNTFRTRATPGKTVRAVLVGDMASGAPEQNGIAWQIAQRKPDFIIALGDIVYSGGRVSQYVHHFWTTYNDVAEPGPKKGAPLMATVPVYPVIGNHDGDVAKLPDIPDAFGAFYFFNVPQNGPGSGRWNLPLGKDKAAAAAFRQKVGAQYPAMSVYSFDYGPAHFVALDSNSYTTKNIDKLIPWLEQDLKGSNQPWKFVCFHAPAFHTSKEHYTQQKMRLLQPTFEACGVNVVFAGHVHNYQRSKPLRFEPGSQKPDKRGRVNGEFKLDEGFNGDSNTHPDGVIHIVSGGGGAQLYSVNFEKTVEELKKKQSGNWVPLTAKYYADKHSFSLVEISPSRFELRQVNIKGEAIDKIVITKETK